MWPLLGLMTSDEVAKHYCNDTMSLVLGTFILSIAVQRWGIDKRLALWMVTKVGRHPRLLMCVLMLITMFLGCFMSNTSTATIMTPIATSLVTPQDQLQPDVPADVRQAATNFSKGLVLCIAYTCSTSGFATLTGTGPNMILAGLWRQSSGEDIGWLQWLAFALPLSALLNVCVYCICCGVYCNSPTSVVAQVINMESLLEEKAQLPAWRLEETVVVLHYVVCVVLWTTRTVTLGAFNGWGVYFPFVGNGTVAVMCAASLFAWPAQGTRPALGGAAGTQGPRVMDWDAANKLKWSTLLLIGGGFALSAGVEKSGLSNLIAKAFEPLQDLQCHVTVLVTIVLVVFITDWLLSSNVAVATLVLPILNSSANHLKLDPLALLIPATIACSMSYCSPVSTPPNAIAFSTGVMHVRDMVSTGALVAICGIILTWLFALYIVPFVFSYSTC
ncbi:hypothetical protein CYMTET_19701 [Cymbomonas tetramitiformis]|uniref:Uncharacterized protein n=1 Tax=Cymbomonas tetramitiformis TaxID=36881 RepID=A0AAE0G5I2_9CHLO|nr:hypothetical protein CYMTET_19701 [Cymbomonas tetramitiformis]